MEYKHGFTVTDDDDPGKILHVVLFENKPSVEDWNHIIKELETDPDFEYLEDFRWTMRYSTPDEVKHFNEQLENGNIRYNSEDIPGEQIQ